MTLKLRELYGLRSLLSTMAKECDSNDFKMRSLANTTTILINEIIARFPEAANQLCVEELAKKECNEVNFYDDILTREETKVHAYYCAVHGQGHGECACPCSYEEEK